LAYVHDPFPMHSYPRPYDWVEPGHQYKRDFFLNIVDKAKQLVYPSKYLAEWMQSYYPKQKGKEIIIPHQISNEKQAEVMLSNYFIKRNFNILHAGNMMSARNPKALIEAFEVFLKENPEAKEVSNLIFIGNPCCYDTYIKTRQKTTPQLVLSDGYLPFETVFYMQQHTTVNVILEAKGTFSPFLPGKFPHCIQAEKPILLLSPYYSESKRLLGDNYPYWSPINDVELIANHLSNLYKEWLSNGNVLEMKRSDLIDYLGVNHLKETINNLISS